LKKVESVVRELKEQQTITKNKKLKFTFMASCYHCGRAGANYRRTVTTGRSNTTYYGKKSTTFSSRTNSGLRTVCENCAADIDKSRYVLTTVFLVISGFVMLYFIFKYL
jgi:hypothetical protein